MSLFNLIAMEVRKSRNRFIFFQRAAVFYIKVNLCYEKASTRVSNF